ncbi:MAG: Crp/Fnr family transcriptional regulator [Acidobacteria bacterium]|nr:Crp/Fnr family transcriptional regulator [Acidobacteriota bacterium]
MKKVTAEILRNNLVFASLAEEDMEYLLKVGSYRSFRKRDIIYFPDDPANEIFFIVEGRVKLSRIFEDGREIILEILKNNDIFGEEAVISFDKRENMATAMDNVVLLSFEAKAVRALAKRNASLAFRLLELVNGRRVVLERKVEDLAFRNVPSRLARVLLELAEEYGEKFGENIVISTKLSQQDIGNLIGSTRETTSHFLNQFKKIGFIDFNKRMINIINKEKLEELIEQLVPLN